MKLTSTVEAQVTNKSWLDLHQTRGCDWSTSHGWFGSHWGREHPAVFSSMVLILFEKTFVSLSSNIFQVKVCLDLDKESFFHVFSPVFSYLFPKCYYWSISIDQYPVGSTRKGVCLVDVPHSRMLPGFRSMLTWIQMWWILTSSFEVGRQNILRDTNGPRV